MLYRITSKLNHYVKIIQIINARTPTMAINNYLPAFLHTGFRLLMNSEASGLTDFEFGLYLKANEQACKVKF